MRQDCKYITQFNVQEFLDWAHQEVQDARYEFVYTCGPEEDEVIADPPPWFSS